MKQNSYLNCEKILCFCNSERSLSKLIKRGILKQHVLVATENLQTYALIEEYGGRAVFLESQKSLLYFQKKVWQEIDQINRIIDCEELTLENFGYKVNYHIEGAGLQQDIIDIYMRIATFEDLLTEQKVDGILLFSKDFTYEDEEILFQITQRFNLAILLDFKHSYRTKHKIKFWVNRIKKLLGHMRDNFFQIKYMTKRICQKAKKGIGSRNDATIQQFDIGILRAGSFCDKELVRVRRLIEKIKLNTFSYCLITNNLQDKVSYEERKISADSFQNYSSSLLLIFEWIKYRKRALSYKKKLLTYKFEPFDYDMCDIMKNKYLKHIYVESFYNMVAIAEGKSFFDNNQFKIIIENGNSNLLYTQIAYFCSKSKPIFTSALEHDMPVIKGLIHEPLINITNIMFCLNSRNDDSEYFNKNLFHGKLVEMKSFQRTHMFFDRNQAKKLEGKIKVLWAPTGIVNGLAPFLLKRENNNFVCNYFLKHNCEVFVKFHPGTDKRTADSLFESYELQSRVRFLNDTVCLEDALEQIDFVITDISGIKIDAAMKGKPVICLARKYMYDFIFDEDSIKVIRTLEQFREYFNEILISRERLSAWSQKIVSIQDEYLKKFISEDDELEKVMNEFRYIIEYGEVDYN